MCPLIERLCVFVFRRDPLADTANMTGVMKSTILLWLFTLVIDRSVENIHFLGTSFGQLEFGCTGQNFRQDGAAFQLVIGNTTVSKSIMPAKMQLRDDGPQMTRDIDFEDYCKERNSQLILCGGDERYGERQKQNNCHQYHAIMVDRKARLGGHGFVTQWPNTNLLSTDWPIDISMGAMSVYKNRLVLEVPPIANSTTCEQHMFVGEWSMDIPLMLCLSTRLVLETLHQFVLGFVKYKRVLPTRVRYVDDRHMAVDCPPTAERLLAVHTDQCVIEQGQDVMVQTDLPSHMGGYVAMVYALGRTRTPNQPIIFWLSNKQANCMWSTAFCYEIVRQSDIEQIVLIRNERNGNNASQATPNTFGQYVNADTGARQVGRAYKLSAGSCNQSHCEDMLYTSLRRTMPTTVILNRTTFAASSCPCRAYPNTCSKGAAQYSYSAYMLDWRKYISKHSEVEVLCELSGDRWGANTMLRKSICDDARTEGDLEKFTAYSGRPVLEKRVNGSWTRLTCLSASCDKFATRGVDYIFFNDSQVNQTIHVTGNGDLVNPLPEGIELQVHNASTDLSVKNSQYVMTQCRRHGDEPKWASDIVSLKCNPRHDMRLTIAKSDQGVVFCKMQFENSGCTLPSLMGVYYTKGGQIKYQGCVPGAQDLDYGDLCLYGSDFIATLVPDPLTKDSKIGCLVDGDGTERRKITAQWDSLPISCPPQTAVFQPVLQVQQRTTSDGVHYNVICRYPEQHRYPNCPNHHANVEISLFTTAGNDCDRPNSLTDTLVATITPGFERCEYSNPKLVLSCKGSTMRDQILTVSIRKDFRPHMAYDNAVRCDLLASDRVLSSSNVEDFDSRLWNENIRITSGSKVTTQRETIAVTPTPTTTVPTHKDVTLVLTIVPVAFLVVVCGTAFICIVLHKRRSPSRQSDDSEPLLATSPRFHM